MPINSIAAKPRLPILGKIRLGIRKESSKGSLYPVEVEHFVLSDAPEVAAVYGDDPKELDCFFPSDDIDAVLPTWFKAYGAGKKDSQGNLIGGKINCMGDGPREELIDDVIVKSPGTAQHFAARDPVTKIVPPRPCMGQECPDYIAKKCKQTMKVVVIIPTVSLYGAFQIDTTSWHAIHSFHDQVRHVQNMHGGSFKFFPFKIFREETVTTHDEDGKQVTKVHHIMKIKPNEKLYELQGGAIRDKIAQFKNARFTLTGVAEDVNLGPMEDHFPVLPEGRDEGNVVDITAQKKSTAEDLLKDPDIVDAFMTFEGLLGKRFDDKARLIAIRKKENSPDIKAAVLDELNRKISELVAKQPPIDTAPQTPKASGDGIM